MTSKTTTKYAPEVREGAVRRVFYANFRVYGVRKVWRQPQREGLTSRAARSHSGSSGGGQAGLLTQACFSMRWNKPSTIADRRTRSGGLIHHSDRSSQYVSIKYTERLAEAEIESSVGSVGDSYDNALAETINGLHKAEVIHRRGPWRNFEAVEYATLEWVNWFNHRRLREPIGNIPPAEAEEQYYAMIEQRPMAA